MKRERVSKHFLKRINRRKILTYLGITLGIMLAGINILKDRMIRTFNRLYIRESHIRDVKRVPSFDPDTWRLTVDGLVDIPLVISYNELLKLESEELITDSRCAGRWHGIKWKGIQLRVLFEKAGLKPDAAFAIFYSASDIYSDTLPIKEALEPYSMLAYMLNDELLPVEQGRPLRLVIPGVLGYKSVKWINRITLTRTQEKDIDYLEGFDYKMEGVSSFR